jgi:hypothetical protein
MRTLKAESTIARELKNDQYTKQEAQRRFLTAIKAALNTPPNPLKDIPKKRAKSAAKRRVR